MPSIWICKGGLGGPFRTVWKTTFLRNPCEKKRLATMLSWTMSKRPASCRLRKLGSVFPKREKSINSRVNCQSQVLLFTSDFLNQTVDSLLGGYSPTKLSNAFWQPPLSESLFYISVRKNFALCVYACFLFLRHYGSVIHKN